jgi:hypothetical protein
VAEEALQPLLQPARAPLLDCHVDHPHRARPAHERPPLEREVTSLGRDHGGLADVRSKLRVRFPPSKGERLEAGLAPFDAGSEVLAERGFGARVLAPPPEGALQEALGPKA